VVVATAAACAASVRVRSIHQLAMPQSQGGAPRLRVCQSINQRSSLTKPHTGKEKPHTSIPQRAANRVRVCISMTCAEEGGGGRVLCAQGARVNKPAAGSRAMDEILLWKGCRDSFVGLCCVQCVCSSQQCCTVLIIYVS